MREPKLYGPYPPKTPGAAERYFVQWYDDDQGGPRKKQFSDPIVAELFYQEKLLGQPIDKEALILKEVATIKKYVAGGHIAAIEAENARLREENARLIQNAPSQPSEEPQIESLASDVRLLRMDLAIKLKSKPAAIVLQQLYWCLEIRGWGKILEDRQRYVFNTYDDWKDKYFQCYSVPTLKRAFGILEKKGLVFSRQPDGRASRRKYYRLAPEGINLIRSGDVRSKRSDPADQKDTHIGSKRAVPCSERESTSNTGNRPQAAVSTRSSAELENELLDHIKDLCGPEEMKNNGGMWRTIARSEARALRNAIEDLKLRSDNYHLTPMRNPGAMLMAALKRCREQIARSLAHTHATQKK